MNSDVLYMDRVSLQMKEMAVTTNENWIIRKASDQISSDNENWIVKSGRMSSTGRGQGSGNSDQKRCLLLQPSEDGNRVDSTGQDHTIRMFECDVSRSRHIYMDRIRSAKPV
jgi:hypothetical protein